MFVNMSTVVRGVGVYRAWVYVLILTRVLVEYWRFFWVLATEGVFLFAYNTLIYF
jgi:hypothetical protein